jgi:hypothetical protein
MGGTRLLVNIPLAAIADGLGRKPLLVAGPVVSSFAMVRLINTLPQNFRLFFFIHDTPLSINPSILASLYITT